MNLLWNSLSSQEFPIYLHEKLYKNANVVNFVYYGELELDMLHLRSD